MEKEYRRPTEAAAYLKISRATLYRWAKLYEDFPKSIKLGDRTAVWDLGELEAFIQSRKAAV